jgi:Gas vesicle protein G
VIVIDKLIVNGLKFVLSRVAEAVDVEMNDEGRLREELLAAQMRHELGEIDAAELDAIERAILKRLREIREERGEPSGPSAGYKVTGIEASVVDDEKERR